MVYIPKSGRFSCVFKNKLLSCKIFLKKRLSKVIPHFKNAVNDKGTCRNCGDRWTYLSNKNYWFPKHKDYPTVKGRREGNWNEGNVNIPKAPDERAVNEKDLLSPYRITFKFLYDAQCHFENKRWNKNEMLEYLRTCCFSKNVAFNAIKAFQKRARISWTGCLTKVCAELQCICYTWASRNTL